MPPRLPVTAALLSLLLSRCTATCTSDSDCSLLGTCSISAACVCDPGWRGEDCGVLDLAPATRGSGYNLTSAGTSSWGGRIVRDPADAGLHHLFAAEFTGGCGLDDWAPFSRIIRATSKDGAAGPYVFASEVAKTFAHNPTVVWSPQERLWLMWHIGCPQSVPPTCGAPAFSCDGGDSENGESGITMRTSPDLLTWTEVGRVLTNNTEGLWDTDSTNPSGWVQTDGSIVLFYRGCPYNCNGNELLSFATAPSSAGPYTRARTQPIFSAPAEDPMVWQDRRGRWHVLMHSLEPDGGCVCGGAGEERLVAAILCAACYLTRHLPPRPLAGGETARKSDATATPRLWMALGLLTARHWPSTQPFTSLMAPLRPTVGERDHSSFLAMMAPSLRSSL